MDWLSAASMLGSGLGMWGQQDANRSNERQAQKQMDFQSRMATSAQSFSERMANTAVQRSVADYKAAGLNPALAYERSAAAPQGVTAGGAASRDDNTMRDAPALISNALAAQQMKQQMQIAEDQRQGQLAIIHNTAEKLNAEREVARQQAWVLQAERLDRGQKRWFEAQNQPHTNRALQLQNLAGQLGITGLENEQELEAKIQSMSKGKGGGGNAKFLLQLFKTILQQKN